MTQQRTVALLAEDQGAAVTKFLVVQYLAQGNPFAAAEIAAERCRSVPLVEHMCREIITKAAVGAAALGASDPYGLGGQAFALLQSQSIFGKLMPKCRKIPFRVKVPKDTGAGGTGAWRAEGTAGPLTQNATATLTQDVFISDYIAVVTQELLRFGQVAESALRTMLFAGLARWIDSQLLDPTVAATSSHPASLTNGVATISSAGTTAANIVTDLRALLTGTTSPLDNAYFVMRQRTYLNCLAALASVGYDTTPGFLMGIPVIAGSTSPHQVALIDADNIAYSSDDALGLELSTESVVQMDSAPTQSGITGTGSAAVSLWQLGLAAIRAEMHVSWQHVHYNGGSPTVPAGAAVVTGVSY